MREFDSPGLRSLRTILQTSRGPPQFVDLQDEILQQGIDVFPVIRRDLTLAQSSGIFTASLLNTHVGSDTIVTDVNPYSPGTTFVAPEYPDPLPENVDVYLLDAQAETSTGSGDFGGGFFGLISNGTAMAWRNVANEISVINVLQYWNIEATRGNRVVLYDQEANVAIYNSRGAGAIRISRHADMRIRFETVKAGVGAASYLLSMLLGVFPKTLGQDVLK